MLPTISSYNNTADADLDVLAEFIASDKADMIYAILKPEQTNIVEQIEKE